MVHQAIFTGIGRIWPSEGLPAITVALELSASSLILVASTDGPVDASGFKVIETKRIPVKGTAETARAVRDFAAGLLQKAAGPPPTFRWLVSFPRHLVLVRFLTLPSLDLREIKMMADLQARTGLPFAEDEWVTDTIVLRQDRVKRSSEALVAIVRKTTLVPYVDLLEQARIYPDGFILSSFSLADFVQHTVPALRDDYAHLDFAGEWMTIDLFSGRQLSSSRSIPFADGNFDPGRIVEECRHSLASGGQDRTLFVTGCQLSLKPALALALEKQLGISATFLMAEKESLEVIPPSARSAARVNPEWTMMLLPPGMVQKRVRQLRRSAISEAAIWAGVWLALILGIAGSRIYQKERRLASLDAEMQTLAPQVQGISDAEERRAATREVDGANPLDVLRQLHLDAPAAVALRTVSCEPGGQCSFLGSAPTLSVAMEFVDRLQKSSAFSSIELTSSATSSEANNEHIDFQIQGEWKMARARGGRGL